MTTQATHTPGPWTATHDATSKAAAYRIEGGKHHVASIRGDKAASHFRAEEANAHLIASAPDLLEALRALAECVEGYRQTGCLVAWDKPLGEARAAISKAEGRAQ